MDVFALAMPIVLHMHVPARALPDVAASSEASELGAARWKSRVGLIGRCRPLPLLLPQVTLFPAILALDARREARMRAGKGGCGCVAPGTCFADDYENQIVGGLNGWTPEAEIRKVSLLLYC